MQLIFLQPSVYLRHQFLLIFISFSLQFEGVHRRKRKNRSSYPRPRQEKQPLGGERKMSNYVIRLLPSERSSPFFLCCTTSTNRTDVWFIKAYGDNRLTKKKCEKLRQLELLSCS